MRPGLSVFRYGVLMEDLATRGDAGASFPSALRSAPVVEVQALLANLARLHGHFWDSARFRAGGDLRWLATHLHGGMQPTFQAIGFGLVADQVKRHQFKAELIAPLNRSVKQLWDAVRVAQRLLEADTPTLCHGDTHVANTFTFVRGGQPAKGLFDFQLAIRGSFIHDVCYAIVTSLSPDDRREHERALLQFYLAELQTTMHPGTAPPSFDATWLRYRQTAIWGLVIGWLICPPANYGVPITAANIRRTATACLDLGTLDALGV